MAFFRDPFGGINRSPSRSIYGLSGGDIIVPIDFVVLTLTSGSLSAFDPLLPSQLTGADIRLNGASVVGQVHPTSNPSPISSVDPIVRVSNSSAISFPSVTPTSTTDVLLPNEPIMFTNNLGRILGGNLIDTTPQSGLPYLDGSFTVEAFRVSLTSGISNTDIGSMVIVSRLGKSLGMLLGYSSGTPIVYPAYNI
jgi:hypothetical protein